MKKPLLLLGAVGFALGTLIQSLPAAQAQAQTYPQRQVRIIVTNPPGQSSDTITRLFAQRLTASLGQSFFIENRPGAGGNIGSAVAAKAAPDGYSLLLGTAATFGMNMAMYDNVGYDPERDFVPIGLLGRVAMVVAATPQSGIRSMPELVARAKAEDLGIGLPSTMATVVADLIRNQGNLRLKNVPYKGSAQSTADALGGHIPLVVDTSVVIAPQAALGKLVPLGITTAQQSPLMPGLKTVAEQGMPGFEVTGWFMLFAPAGTPAHIIQTLNKGLKTIAADPEIQKQLVSNGFGPTPVGDVEALPGFVATERTRWVSFIKAAGLKASP
jgi:tripartite-type tricarboxylate transporter receptor subunit TctC